MLNNYPDVLTVKQLAEALNIALMPPMSWLTGTRLAQSELAGLSAYPNQA